MILRKFFLFLFLIFCVNVLVKAQNSAVAPDKSVELLKSNNLIHGNINLSFGAHVINNDNKLWKAASPNVIITYNWTGIISTAWETAGNWSSNVVPSDTSNVIIPSGRSRYPVVSMNTSVKSLNCQPGAAVTVASGVVLNVLK